MLNDTTSKHPFHEVDTYNLYFIMFANVCQDFKYMYIHTTPMRDKQCQKAVIDYVASCICYVCRVTTVKPLV